MLAIFQALLGVPAQYKNDGYASAIALEYGGKCEAFCADHTELGQRECSVRRCTSVRGMLCVS